MMEFKDVMLARRSVRKFKTTEISEDQVNYILHMGMSGPSCRNEQSWEFYVVRNKAVIEQLRHVGKHESCLSPLDIVVAGNLARTMAGDLQPFWIQDASIAAENVLLACTDAGLGAVWIGLYPKEIAVNNARQILNLPDTVMPLALISIGVPDEQPQPKDYYDENKIHRIL